MLRYEINVDKTKALPFSAAGSRRPHRGMAQLQPRCPERKEKGVLVAMLQPAYTCLSHSDGDWGLDFGPLAKALQCGI